MFGNNPIRPPESGDGSVLQVQELFATVQGEGPRAGQPAVFVRLGGCNLACSFCDTEFESFSAWPLERIVARVQELAKSDDASARTLVVITGGEPLRQNIAPLCEELMAQGFTVQLETNGTLMRALPADVEIVCSPKNTGKGYFPLRDDVLARVNALKFIVSSRHPLYREVPEVGQRGRGIPIYVQPMDEHDEQVNRANMLHAAQLAQRVGGRLSLQLHKIVRIA